MTWSTHMKRTTHAISITIATLIAATGSAHAQADFSEDFESLVGSPQGVEPQVLINQGWEFRNQSEPVNGASWMPGDNFGGVAFDGSGYLTTSGLATNFFGGAVSSWAILPENNNQQAGDTFTVWVYSGGAFSNSTYFDVRYAPIGSDTGSDANDVGDFSQVLYSAELPVSDQGYQRVQVEIPGDGRIAMRFHAPFLQTFAGNGAIFSIDTVSVGSAGSDPCGIPLPNPGQMVVWDQASGPYVLCQDLLIPSGGRVEIEPGTVVDCSGGKLSVEGELIADSGLGSPIRFLGSQGFNAQIEFDSGGSGTFINTEIGARISVSEIDSSLRISDSRLSNTEITGVGGFASFDACTFDNASVGNFSPLSGTIKLTNSSFINGGYASVAGILHLDQISIDGSMLNIAGETTAHPVLLDNISVTNNTSGPGIKMYGPNFLLGKNVTLSGNRYPLEMDFLGAGLLPGSLLPTSGNTNNYVPVDHLAFAQQRQWADTGIPYVIDSFADNRSGSLTVEPGANLKFKPDAGSFIVGSATLVLQGTREEPILIESFNPNQPWFGLKWVDDFDAKMRHTIVDSGQIAVQSDGGVMDLVHTTVRNAQEGTASVTGGIVRLYGSQIIDNDVGMVTTTSGRIEADGFVAPSIFEGNAIAIEYNNNNGIPFVRNNWWGDPSGPTSILHPTGQGDEVLNVHPAGFTPFLTSPPVIDDDFPTIDLEPVYFTMQTGDKVLLRWSSGDDDEVVEHRIEFADHDFPSEFQTVAVLGADEFSYEFTAPSVAPNNLYPTPSAIRVIAVDSAGQESWDKARLRIPYQEDWLVVEQTVELIGPVVRPHERVDVCWGPGGFASAHVLMDGIGMSDSAGGTTTGCLPIGATLPYSSTDTARVLVTTTFGAGGRLLYSFGDYFSIRPSELLGDEPPAVQVSSPSSGDQYFGQGTIPVRWDASDDEGLRSFRVQASYDAGRTWHSIVRDLAGDVRAFDWKLPDTTGMDDVRVRVVAVDHRFQDSSHTTGSFSIGATNPCPADLNGDGVLNFFDVSAFLNAFNDNSPIADLNGDGQLNFFDVSLFLNSFGAGCP